MSARPIMLRHIHASHISVESCLRKARDILFWPKLSQDLKNYASECEVSNEIKPHQTKELMQFHNLPEKPWRKVGMYVFTLYNHDNLVTVDFHSDFGKLMN